MLKRMYVPQGGDVFGSHHPDKNHVDFITTGHNRDNMRGFPARLLYLILLYFFYCFPPELFIEFYSDPNVRKTQGNNQFSPQADTCASLKATKRVFSALK